MTVTDQPFDDELLSAYLDDELTPEERARVEERLAADPRARQLLDELRIVSRAMKELAPATLDGDLRDSVLRRAERAMLLPGESASARGLNDIVRKIPFGRSRRAWFWAAAALAAGLLLMVFEQMPGENRDLPRVVAMRDHLESDRSAADTDLRMRALESPDSPPSLDATDDVMASAPATEPVAGREPTAVPPTAGLARRAVGSPAPAHESVVVRDDVEFRGGGGLSGGRASGNDSMVVVADRPSVTADFASMIVNVQCNPEAMQNRTFDALFEENHLEVEPPAADKAKRNELQSVDVVVVEADPAQIRSCIKAISDDQVNYVAINVEERSPPSQNDLVAKKPAPDVKQYNRGRFQNQQQVEIAPSNDRYYYSMNRGGAQLGLGFSYEGKAESQRSDESVLGDEVVGQTEGAPMAKMSTSAAEPSTRGEPSTAANAPTGGVAFGGRSIDSYQGGELQENLARRASQKLATKAEMLQVLFVFQCPTFPSAPDSVAAPATSVPATSAPAEEGGLMNDDR